MRTLASVLFLLFLVLSFCVIYPTWMMFVITGLWLVFCSGILVLEFKRKNERIEQ